MITELQVLKRLAGIQDADKTDNDILFEIQQNVEKYVSKYCDRTFESSTLTEYYDGGGSDTLILRNYPVSSITSVHDDTDRDFNADSLIDPDDYVLYDEYGILRLDGLIFSNGVRNVKIVYIAGYTEITMPFDLKNAIYDLMVADYMTKKASINALSGSDNGERIKELNDNAHRILDTYKRMRAS